MSKEEKFYGFDEKKAKDSKKLKRIYDDKRVKLVLDTMRKESDDYKDPFKSVWANIHRQLNYEFPEGWEQHKDAWMAKVFVAMQQKISEGAYAIIMEMCFGNQKNFFAVSGHQQEDHILETELAKFFKVLLNMGDFYVENGYVVKEGVNYGSSFLKVLVDPDKKKRKLNFEWRSAKNVGFDPSAITNFNKYANYVFEPFEMQMDEILANPRISKERKSKILIHYHNKTGEHNQDKKLDNLAFELSDGGEIKISEKYQTVPVEEWIINFPQEWEKTVEDDQGNKRKVKYIKREWRLILIADKEIVLRNNKNEYEDINLVKARLRRTDDSPHGDGFLRATATIADASSSLASTMVDGAKMGVTNMYKVDPQSIIGKFRVKPWGKIKMKLGQFAGLDIINMANPKIAEAINVILFLDEMAQEMSAITRDVSGTPEQMGSQRPDTLGQTQIKIRNASRKLLRIAMDFTEDYMIPLFRLILKIVTLPQFIDMFQDLANDVLGFKKDTIADPKTGKRVRVPNLVLERVAEMDLNFTPLALLDFAERVEQYNKLVSMIQLGVQNSPEFANKFFSRLDEAGLFERWIEMSGITDPKKLVKSNKQLAEDKKDRLERLMQNLGAEGQNPQGGIPRRNVVNPNQSEKGGF